MKLRKDSALIPRPLPVFRCKAFNTATGRDRGVSFCGKKSVKEGISQLRTERLEHILCVTDKYGFGGICSGGEQNIKRFAGVML